ncbi:MAG: galactokinase, partial [Rikenellaceae bacterium]
RRESCERAVAAIRKSHPEVEFLRDAKIEWLEDVIGVISTEDYVRSQYAIEEVKRLLDACEALEKGDYETVGKKMYGTHIGMSVLYEVSCEELDFVNEIAKECGVTGSRVMGGGFGGCTINIVKAEKYDNFIKTVTAKYRAKYGIDCKIYPVVISDGARKLC